MKKLVLAIFVVASIGKSSAQNEYFQHNPEWTVLEAWSQSYPCISWDTVTFYINGDTLVNSLTYKKLYARGTGQNVWMSSNPNMTCPTSGPHNYQYTGYTGCLRSDTARIYYIHNGFTQESIISDFTLAVGDTFPITTTMINPNETVAFIDSFYTPYGYQKKFHLASDTSAFILEGGGSSYGLYHYVGPMMDFGSWLMCYSLNDTAWWPVQGPDCDAILLSTPSFPQQSISLQLVPNPATEFVEIRSTGYPVESVTVYDVFGRAVKYQVADSKIFVGDLHSGIYTCVIASGETRISKLLVVE